MTNAGREPIMSTLLLRAYVPEYLKLGKTRPTLPKSGHAHSGVYGLFRKRNEGEQP